MAKRSGSTAITDGESVNEPGSSNTGWLRITATEFGGTEFAATSGSSGTAICTFQSAPTCWCAVSSWLRSTIARYEVETISRPTASTSRSEVAKLVPGDRLSRRVARYVGRLLVRATGRSRRRRTQSSSRSARNESAKISSVGVSSTSGSSWSRALVDCTDVPRSSMNVNSATGSTNSSTGTREISGRSSRESRRRSSRIVRRTCGSESSSSVIAPTNAPIAPRTSANVDSPTGKSTPGSDGPFAFEASVARAMPSNRPSGYATIAVNSAWTPCAASSLPEENPRLRRTASSNDCLDRTSEPTPAKIASVTAPIWNTTRKIGTRRSSTRCWTSVISVSSPVLTWSWVNSGVARSSSEIRSISCGIRSAWTNGTPTRSRKTSHTYSLVTPSAGITSRYPAWSISAGESSVESGGGNGVWSPNQNGSSRFGGSKRPTSVSSVCSPVGPIAVTVSPTSTPSRRAIPPGSAISPGPCGGSPR